MKKLIIVVAVLLAPMDRVLAFDEALTLKAEAVGVVYLKRETARDYTLKIVVPESFVIDGNDGGRLREGDRVIFPKKLKLFDHNGLLGEIRPPSRVNGELYCENDGGDHSWPAFTLKVTKSTLMRPLYRNAEADGIAAFVSLGIELEPVTIDDARKTKEGLSIYGSDSGYFAKTLITGRLSSKGNAVAAVSKEWSEAGCGNGLEQNGLFLKTHGHEVHLRCCGP